jgi:hypothetical protein
MRKVETQRVSKLAPLPHHELIDVNDFDRRIEEQRKAGFYALSCEVLKPAAYLVLGNGSGAQWAAVVIPYRERSGHNWKRLSPGGAVGRWHALD